MGEPVDEDDLRVGDEISVTLTGRIEAIKDGCPFLIHADGTRTPVSGGYGDAAWVMLRRAEPQPDEGEVRAFAQVLRDHQPDAAVWDIKDWRDYARELLRSGRMQIVAPDDTGEEGET